MARNRRQPMPSVHPPSGCGSVAARYVGETRPQNSFREMPEGIDGARELSMNGTLMSLPLLEKTVKELVEETGRRIEGKCHGGHLAKKIGEILEHNDTGLLLFTVPLNGAEVNARSALVQCRAELLEHDERIKGKISRDHGF